MPSTLVFHHGALGDGVILWPLLRAMGPLSLISPRERAQLAAMQLEGVEAVDGDRPDWARLFAPRADLEVDGSVRILLAGATCIVSFVSDGQDVWAANIAALAPNATIFFGPPKPTAGSTTHLLEQTTENLTTQGWSGEPQQPDRRRNNDGPVVLHPGSGGDAKRWPAERFIQLARQTIAIGRPVQIVIGPVEQERVDADTLRQWGQVAERIEPASPSDLARVLGRASVVVANDSGPAHLAAQIGVPTIVLFGPTDPRIWAPTGPVVIVVAPPEPQPMTWLGLDMVIEALGRWS
jgi:heptosyltransferase-3